jgi:hypothetical protein
VAGRPPALWRTARILRILGYVALAILIVFVATAIYSAVQARPQFNTGSESTTFLATNSTVELALGLNLSNPGAYPISGVGISAQVRLPDGTLVARGGSPDVTVAPGTTATLPIELWVPLDAGSDVLLTHDLELRQAFWANATFAGVFALEFNDSKNASWGAPFYQFNATAGTPTPEPNGTVEVPVEISWQDAASFDEVGSVLLQVRSPSQQVCGSDQLPVDVAAGSNADLPASFYLAPSCDPAGGTLQATYTGNGLTFAFPPEAIP